MGLNSLLYIINMRYYVNNLYKPDMQKLSQYLKKKTKQKMEVKKHGRKNCERNRSRC